MPSSSSTSWNALAQRLRTEDCVCVTVERHEGSVPRERGAWMLVFGSSIEGTIGGGHLELEAIHKARALLAEPGAADDQTSEDPAENQTARFLTARFALGPSLGQCCGGVVWLKFEIWFATQFVAASDDKSMGEGEYHVESRVQNRVSRLQDAGLRLPTLALFGGGHVGQAIVAVASALPMPLSWIDSRDEIFPSDLPPNVTCEHSAPVQAAVHDAALVPGGSRLLIMSFSHAEDLEICAAALMRQRQHADLSFIGLIGSKTKWATFRKRLAERGFSEAELAQITCPIGLDGIEGKEPGVIAVACAAQLLRLPTGLPTMPESSNS
jgi:xanthine dehydrogenase accessory factor